MNNPAIAGTFAILLNPQGSVLAAKRINVYGAGFFGFPGGHVEPGEDPLATIRREVIEETGLELDNFELLDDFIEDQPADKWGPKRKFRQIAFVCRGVAGDPKNMEPDKSENWHWFEPNDILSKLLPGHRMGLEAFLKLD